MINLDEVTFTEGLYSFKLKEKLQVPGSAVPVDIVYTINKEDVSKKKPNLADCSCEHTFTAHLEVDSKPVAVVHLEKFVHEPSKDVIFRAKNNFFGEPTDLFKETIVKWCDDHFPAVKGLVYTSSSKGVFVIMPDDEEAQLEVIKYNVNAIAFVKKPTEAMLLEIIKRDYSVNFVKKYLTGLPDEWYVKAAKINYRVLAALTNVTEEMIMAAVTSNADAYDWGYEWGYCLKFEQSMTKEKQEAFRSRIIDANCYAIGRMRNASEQLQKQAIDKDVTIVFRFWRSFNKKMIRYAYSTNPKKFLEERNNRSSYYETSSPFSNKNLKIGIYRFLPWIR